MGKTTVKDNGGLALLAKRLAKGASVRVGILQDAPKESKDGDAGPATLMEVAAIHEFGAPQAHIPQRSFIRAAFDEKEREIRSDLAKVAKLVVFRKATIEQGLAMLGARIVGYMQKRIASGIEPENAPSTIAKKGSSKPLIDTGQLRNAITFEIIPGGKK